MNPEAMPSDLAAYRAAKLKNRLLVEEMRTKRLEGVKKRVELRESAEAWEWLDAYAGVYDRLQDQTWLTDGYLISTAQDRRYGHNWPFWRSWQEHARLRAAARVLHGMSPTVSGVIGGIGSYVIADGFTFRAAAKPTAKGVPAELIAAAQEAIDDFAEANEWGPLQLELWETSRVDGEAFLRLFTGKDGLLKVRPVGPELVVEPTNMDFDTQSYGVETDPDDTHEVLGYHVAYDGNNADAEFVPAGEMVHWKLNAPRQVKRGLSDLSFDTMDLLKSSGRLLENTAEGTAIQASIALIMEHDGASKSEVEEFVSASSDRSGYDPASRRTRGESRYGPGRREDIPKGSRYVQPPFMANAQAAVAIYQAVLRGAGQKWGTPEWLISGDASNNNYASALVSEAPFAKRCRVWHGYYGPRFLRVVKAAVKARCDAKRLIACGRSWSWEELIGLVTVTAEPPSLQTRDTLKEAQEGQIHLEMGTTSRQILCQEAGRDWQQVQRDNREYDESQPRVPQGETGGGGSQPPPGGGPAPTALQESGGWDESRHQRADDGRFGSGGGAAEEKPPSAREAYEREKAEYDGRQADREARREAASKRREAAAEMTGLPRPETTPESDHLALLDEAARDFAGIFDAAEAGGLKEAMRVAIVLEKAKVKVAALKEKAQAAAGELAKVEAAIAELGPEPPQPPDPEYAPDPKREDFGSDAEFEAARAADDAEADRVNAEHEKAETAHEKAFGRWEKAFERLDAKRDALAEKRDEALDAADEACLDAWDACDDLAYEAAAKVEKEIDEEEEEIDAEEAEDEEPEEPDDEGEEEADEEEESEDD